MLDCFMEVRGSSPGRAVRAVVRAVRAVRVGCCVASAGFRFEGVGVCRGVHMFALRGVGGLDG